jgi:hypothetical protein
MKIIAKPKEDKIAIELTYEEASYLHDSLVDHGYSGIEVNEKTTELFNKLDKIMDSK